MFDGGADWSVYASGSIPKILGQYYSDDAPLMMGTISSYVVKDSWADLLTKLFSCHKGRFPDIF